MKKVLIIGTLHLKEKMLKYKEETEQNNPGWEVRLPVMDYYAEAKTALDVIKKNIELIKWADEVRMFWDGFPVNMGGLSLLMEQMAYNLGIFPGAIKFGSKGLHVYGHSLEPLAMRAGNHELAEKFNEFKKNM